MTGTGVTVQCVLPVQEGDDPGVAAALLWRAGAEGVWIQAGAVLGYFPSPVPGVPDGARWEDVPDVDWAIAWRAGLRPVAAGPFDVVPTWLADAHPERPGRVRIVLDPGRAFGSGHHDTTLGCLEGLAGMDLAGRPVLDVGTGTGILAIAAARRGATPVVGVDLDPDAIEVAATNVRANGVAVELAVGSITAGTAPAAVVDRRGEFGAVVANLLTGTVVDLADDLAAAMAPGGHLVASGVGAPRADLAAGALRRAGLVDVTTRVRGEWAVVCGRAR